MPILYKVLVFVVPQTCLILCYHDNIGFCSGLGRYEDWPIEMFYPDIVFVPKIWVQFDLFVIKIMGWYGMGYAHTIQGLGI